MSVVPGTWRNVGSSALLKRSINHARESLPISMADLSLNFHWLSVGLVCPFRSPLLLAMWPSSCSGSVSLSLAFIPIML